MAQLMARSAADVEVKSLEDIGLRVTNRQGRDWARRYQNPTSSIIGDINLDMVPKVGGQEVYVGSIRVPISRRNDGTIGAMPIASFQAPIRDANGNQTITAGGSPATRWVNQSFFTRGAGELIVEEWERLTRASISAMAGDASPEGVTPPRVE